MNRKMETMLWYLVAVVILVARGRWLRSQDRLVRRCQWCMDQSLQYEGCAICLMSRHLSHLCIIFRTFHDYSQHQLLTKQSCILSSVHSSSATSSNHTISKFFSIRASNSYTAITLSHAAATPQMQYTWIYIYILYYIYIYIDEWWISFKEKKTKHWSTPSNPHSLHLRSFKLWAHEGLHPQSRLPRVQHRKKDLQKGVGSWQKWWYEMDWNGDLGYLFIQSEPTRIDIFWKIFVLLTTTCQIRFSID